LKSKNCQGIVRGTNCQGDGVVELFALQAEEVGTSPFFKIHIFFLAGGFATAF
jgi:hypothetical protein